MPADSLLDNSHVDFVLFKLRNHVQNMDAQSNNVTYMNDLLTSTVTSPASKLAVYFWITSNFIAMSLGFKSIPYLNLTKSAIISIWNYFQSTPLQFMQASPAQDGNNNFIFLQQPNLPYLGPNQN
jgi:hypothetical protein